jgi:hypothetical protein
MARIKIKDLPQDQKISYDELRGYRGGGGMSFDPSKFTQSPFSTAPYGDRLIIFPLPGDGPRISAYHYDQ